MSQSLPLSPSLFLSIYFPLSLFLPLNETQSRVLTWAVQIYRHTRKAVNTEPAVVDSISLNAPEYSSSPGVGEKDRESER